MSKIIRVIRQSCCLFVCHHAENYSGVPSYERIIVETDEGQEVIYQGEKWNEEDFRKKKELGG